VPISNPMDIVKKLTSLPHRGAGTKMEKKAADLLEQYLKSVGASVEREAFTTPKTYIYEVWWIVGGITFGLMLISILAWLAVALVAFCTLSAFFYFDWRSSPLSHLPPKAISENIIAKFSSSAKADKKVILMAHYDSAPVSMLYLPSMVQGMRRSIIIGLALMLLAVFTALFEAMNIGQPVIFWVRVSLILYFLGMGIMTGFDFFRYGYTNGASDNATGTAAAIVTRERLAKNPIPGWNIEVVLTGAEEAGMVGAKKYFQTHQTELDPENTFILNFDSFGQGDLKIIRRTGSLTDVVYNNTLFDTAFKITRENEQFHNIKQADWHTGDFDTIWFARAGIPSLTISAQDENGLIPYLHRKEDTIDNIDEKLPLFAVDFAETIVRHLAKAQ
jgi:hypothetical protein